MRRWGHERHTLRLRVSVEPTRSRVFPELACRNKMRRMQCGIIETAHIEDAIGYPLQQRFGSKMPDCGIPVLRCTCRILWLLRRDVLCYVPSVPQQGAASEEGR